MRTLAPIIVLLLLLCRSVPLRPSTDDYIYKPYSIEEGFPPSPACVYESDDGYVWTGSTDGLKRFDGYAVRTYRHRPGEDGTLPSNRILQVTEDSRHRIWVLTEGGAAVYDRRRDGWQTVTDETGTPPAATALCPTAEGMLIITRRQSLYRCPADGTVARKLCSFSRSTHGAVCELSVWDGRLLLCRCRWGGVFLLDSSTGRTSDAPLPDAGKVTRALVDAAGRVWTSTYNRGLVCSTRRGRILDTYTTANSGLSHNIILCLSEHRGVIRVGTDGGGICLIHPDTRQVEVLRHLPGQRQSLPAASVQCLSRNPEREDFWAGTIKGGLVYVSRSFIHSYADVPLHAPGGLSERAVLSFFQQPGSRTLWIGTDGGGLNEFDPRTHTFRHYPDTWGEKIVSVCGYSAHELLVSIFAKGLYRFDTRTGRLTPFAEADAAVAQAVRYSRMGINVYRDEAASLLILTPTPYRYDLRRRSLHPLKAARLPLQGPVTPAGCDSLYTYLYDLHHLYRLDRRTDSLQIIFTPDSGEPLEAVAADGDNRFWIATDTELTACHPHTGKIEKARKPIPQHIRAMVADTHGQLWIGTDRSLYLRLPESRRMMLLDESDGVPPNEYLKKAVWADPDGRIYMGGINGMLLAESKRARRDTGEQVRLTLAEVRGPHGRLRTADSTSGEVKLGYDERSVTLRVMVSDGPILQKRTFRWEVDGNGTLTVCTETPELTLHPMTSGHYRISVSCSLKDGSWSAPRDIVSLDIAAVWYRTWWFTLLWAAAAAAAAIALTAYLLHRKEEKLNRALQQHRQQMYEEKLRFLININHELRTPLTLIHAPLTQLLQRLPADDPSYPILEKIRKQSVRMKEMLNQVLNLRKAEVGRMTLHTERFDLNRWIADTVADFADEAGLRNITLEVTTDPGIGEADFDDGKHRAILTNLLNNAFKHSPDGSSIRVRTERNETGSRVRISVTDRGRGLAGADPEQLFTRFYQADGETEGVGIGLAYAKALVTLHGGSIGARNAAGGGACFFYELPLPAHDAPHAPAHERQPEQTPPPTLTPDAGTLTPAPPALHEELDTHRYTCLFVDDREDLCRMVARELQGIFRRLYLASNGKEALEIARKEMPDVIVSDVMMPEMNGFELCRQVKEDEEILHTQVILLTARTDERSLKDGYRTGADAYLEKPFEIPTLLEVVKNRLFQREQLRQRYRMPGQAEAEEQPLSSADDAFLFRLNRLMAEHLDDESVNVNFLCREMNTSRASLYNRIKQATGMSPNEYLNRVRMERAKTLLRESRLSITEIAEATGFASSRYFSTAFKKYTGSTPSQYKAESQQEGAADD